MILKLVFAETEVRNRTLIILLAILDAKIINLYIDTVSRFEKSNDIFLAITNGSFQTLGWVTQRDDVVGNVGQVQVEAIDNETSLLERHALPNAVKGINILHISLLLLLDFWLLLTVSGVFVVSRLPCIELLKILDTLLDLQENLFRFLLLIDNVEFLSII